MGELPGPVFGRTHTSATGTCAMVHFIDFVLRIKSTVPPMVSLPILPHYFHPAVTPAFAQPHIRDGRTSVVCSRWVDGYLFQYGIKTLDRPEKSILTNHTPVFCDQFFDLVL